MESGINAATADSRQGRMLKAGRYFLWVIPIVALIVAAHYLGAGPLIRELLAWVGGLGPLAPIVFVAAYIAATVLFVPGAILTIGAGFLFGVVIGSICVSIASTVGATLAFLIGRHLARERVAHWVEANPTFKAIDAAVGSAGWKIVGLTRLSPIFPFNLLNYAFGLTRVSLRDYLLASWVGMLPGTVLYVYIGSLTRDVTGLGGGHASSPASWALDAAGFVATVAVAVYAARIARKALAEHSLAQGSGQRSGQGSGDDKR